MFPQGGSWCHRCRPRSTLLCFRGKSLAALAESAGLSRCIILFTKHHILNFVPVAPGVAQGAAPPSFPPPEGFTSTFSHCYHLTTTTSFHISHSCLHLPTPLSLSLRRVLTHTDPINPTCDLSLTLTKQGAHSRRTSIPLLLSKPSFIVTEWALVLPMFPDRRVVSNVKEAKKPLSKKRQIITEWHFLRLNVLFCICCLFCCSAFCFVAWICSWRIWRVWFSVAVATWFRM